jgi:antitoxin component of RelBE/YafQ-DinJ toxin-antitoxin module
MYGYADYIDVTPEQILQKVTQEEIIEFVLEQPFSFKMRYCSPFREDKKPGCRFELRPDGTLIFIDWGEKFINPSKVHRSVFGMVMDKFGITMDGAIRLLCSQFGLSTSKDEYQPVDKVQYQKREIVDTPTVITYEKKPFSRNNVLFWSQFLIRPEQVKEDNVFSARSFTISNNKGYRVITPYEHCYVYDFIDKVKIYQPYNETYKWITNCDENNIGNIDNLPPTGEELIVQKSYKDHKVLRILEIGLNVIWFQNEGCIPDILILINLTVRFKLITVFYDNDEDGIKAAMKLVEVFNMIKPNCARMVYLPLDKYKHKDPAAFINKEGRQELIEVLKYIGIYGKYT